MKKYEIHVVGVGKLNQLLVFIPIYSNIISLSFVCYFSWNPEAELWQEVKEVLVAELTNSGRGVFNGFGMKTLRRSLKRQWRAQEIARNDLLGVSPERQSQAESWIYILICLVKCFFVGSG